MNKISADHLRKRAYVYIRQSTLGQVQKNIESQRGQYALADRARELGWQDVEVIDDDLGRSGAGIKRPGFERLLSALCDGVVGAVLCVEASRLARNGRDWHTLLEFCSIVSAVLIDADGVYDPQEGLEKTSDSRVREAIELVFRKFSEIGSARGLFFWLRVEKIQVPVAADGTGSTVRWQEARYPAVLSMLKNPVYAGAYAYGRTRTQVHLADGRKRVSRVKRRASADWRVLIRDHHEAYIGWDQYERNQSVIANNAASHGETVRGAVRSGQALLAGLLRCGHCGRKLHVEYPRPGYIRYVCMSARHDPNGICCVRINGPQADEKVTDEVLRCLGPLGIEAAVAALEMHHRAEDDQIQQKSLAIEQARYEAARAQRQYDLADAANRLVASELERRWNAALQAQAALEEELESLRQTRMKVISKEQERTLLTLGGDLRQLWDHPQSPPEFKKRIMRTVLTEIVATAGGIAVQLLVHWRGGGHTTLCFEKVRTGQHRFVTGKNTIELVRGLARLQPDAMIASILNRNGDRTPHGERWTARSICSLRNRHQVQVYAPGEWRDRCELTVEQTAVMLKVSEPTVLNWIRKGRLAASQLCPHAPWVFKQSDVETLTLHRNVNLSSNNETSLQLGLKLQ
jgi:predicted site-specific integrase-resolvase